MVAGDEEDLGLVCLVAGGGRFETDGALGAELGQRQCLCRLAGSQRPSSLTLVCYEGVSTTLDSGWKNGFGDPKGVG